LANPNPPPDLAIRRESTKSNEKSLRLIFALRNQGKKSLRLIFALRNQGKKPLRLIFALRSRGEKSLRFALKVKNAGAVKIQPQRAQSLTEVFSSVVLRVLCG